MDCKIKRSGLVEGTLGTKVCIFSQKELSYDFLIVSLLAILTYFELPWGLQKSNPWQTKVAKDE